MKVESKGPVQSINFTPQELSVSQRCPGWRAAKGAGSGVSVLALTGLRNSTALASTCLASALPGK